MIKYKNIFIKNIYYMLAYAFTNLTRKDFADVGKESFKNIHNLFAAILSQGIGRQLKQGLYREYVNCNENLSTLRGKIDMQGTIKNLVSGQRKIFCNYDELSENNLLNQILKTAALFLLRNENIDDEFKNLLKREILFFSNVDKIFHGNIAWNKIRFPKNNQNYQMLIGICKLIFEGMILMTDKGEYKLAEFLDDKKFCYLYEKFLLAYYQKHFPQLKISAEQISWALDDENKNLLPMMKSDVTISHKNKILIIDAKFYSKTLQENFNIYKVRSDNLYQIFTYVKNKSAKTDFEVSGMLLYTKTEDEIQPDEVYKMSGNKISVKTLDLNKDFSEIEEQLNSIVKENFDFFCH